MTAETRTYGGWVAPSSPGLPGLGLLGTVLALGFLVLAVIAQTFGGLPAAGVVLFLGGLVVGPIAVKDSHGRSAWQRVAAGSSWAHGRRRRQHVYVPSVLRFGQHTLPGLLAPSRLVEVDDLALVHVPAARHYTVLVRVEPDGAALVDPETVDTMVAWWGRWLADLGHEPGLVAASATVETAPDPGHRLQAEVDRLLVDDAPTLAREVLEHAATDYPAASATIRAHVALTFTAVRPRLEEREWSRGGQRQRRLRSDEEMAQLVASRLPGLLRSLTATGAGTARTMTALEVTEHVRTAYDPATGAWLDELRAAGSTTALQWSDAGPAAAVEAWGSMRHDDAASVTWTMTSAPRGAVDCSVLADLLAPHPDVTRKRVTLVYRPHTAAEAAAIADRDLRTAVGRSGGRGVERAGVTAGMQHAEQAAREEASGAGLTRFSLLVTATVDDVDQLAQAAETVDQLGRASRVRLRRAYGAQSAAFAAALGVGVILPAHVAVPDLLREAL